MSPSGVSMPPPGVIAPKRQGLALADACELFDSYLKQLGVIIDGRTCDNHVIGDGWVRVNGYNLKPKRDPSTGQMRAVPLNACLWQLPGDNVWTVGYVDDSQGDCILAETYCRTGANQVIEHLSFGCPGDEAHEIPEFKTLEASLQGTWEGNGDIQRVLFESNQRVTVVREGGTVKGRWLLGGPNRIDIKAQDGTLPQFHIMPIGDNLYFGAGPATWSRDPEQFVFRLDNKRSIRRLDGRCWLILDSPAKQPIELKCPIRTLKSGDLVSVKLPSGELYTLKRVARDADSGAWLGSVMLEGKLSRKKTDAR